MIANLNIKVAGQKKCFCNHIVCPFYHKRVRKSSNPKYKFVFEQCKRFGDRIESERRCGACKIAYPFGVWAQIHDVIPTCTSCT